MKKRPHLLAQITPHDIALYREVCYETARKEYNMILVTLERPVRFLTFHDLLTFYNPHAKDATLFWERFEMLSER